MLPLELYPVIKKRTYSLSRLTVDNIAIASVVPWVWDGSKQVGESLRERGKAKLKSAGESHLWHRAVAIQKEVCTLSPHQLHHSPGHG